MTHAEREPEDSNGSQRGAHRKCSPAQHRASLRDVVLKTRVVIFRLIFRGEPDQNGRLHYKNHRVNAPRQTGAFVHRIDEGF